MTGAAWETHTVSVRAAGELVPVCVGERPGGGAPVLYLHGLGATMNDFAGALTHPAFAGRRLLAFDFPGCGLSSHPRGADPAVDDLVEVTHEVIQTLVGTAPVTLVGHSMGGYVGLRYTVAAPERVERFVNIEGNLTPADCAVISRETAAYAARGYDPATIRSAMAERQRTSADAEGRWYAGCLETQVIARAFVRYCTSLVEASDTRPLLDEMCSLRLPRLFVCGAKSRLSYLTRLVRAGVEVAVIARSGHFPMHSRPSAFLTAIGEFVQASDPREAVVRRAANRLGIRQTGGFGFKGLA